MDAPQATIQEDWQKLGTKTLWIFVFERAKVAVTFLVIAIILFACKGQSFVTASPLGNVARYADIAGWASIAIFIASLAIAFLWGWLVYLSYRFALSDDSLKIRRGFIVKEEISIPYRQIQDVDIVRDLEYQAMGISKLVILTAGQEEEKTSEDSSESEGVFPVIDRGVAERLQEELLHRANVERVTEVK